MIFRIAAIVLFVLAAVFAWFVDDITTRTIIGLIAAGLALFAAEVFDSYITRRP